MPLIKSGSDAARKANIKTLMGEVGKSPHVQSRAQAIAIAYSNQRRAKRADGGAVLLALGALRKRPPNPDRLADGGRTPEFDPVAGLGAMQRETPVFRALANAAARRRQDFGARPSNSERVISDMARQSQDEDYNKRVQEAIEFAAKNMMPAASGVRQQFAMGGVPMAPPMAPLMPGGSPGGPMAPLPMTPPNQFPNMGYPGMAEGGSVEPDAPDETPYTFGPRESFGLFRQRPHEIPENPEKTENLANLGEAVSTAIPTARAIRAFPALAKAAPTAATALGSLYTFLKSGESTEADVKLTRAQKQQQEMERAAAERAEAAAQKTFEREQEAKRLEREGNEKAAAAAAKVAADAAADAKRLEAELAGKKAEGDRAFAEQERDRLAKATFREKNPRVSDLMTNLGMAGAAAVPYGGRLMNMAERALLNSRWVKVANAAEKAAASGDTKLARMYAEQLRGFEAQSKVLAKGGPGAVTWGAAALSPLEVSMLPEQIDLLTGGQEAKEKATSQLLDLAHRVPAALLQGGTFSTLGMKSPLPFTSVPPAGRSTGLMKSIGVAKRARKEPAMATGGALPFYERQGMYSLAKQGMLNSTTPGRGDSISTSVKSGSYVIPADVVSGKGQGNSLAGAAKFDKMFKASPGGAGIPGMRQGPMGTALPAVKKITKPVFSGARTPKLRAKASGGAVGHPTPVALSGGEYIVEPEAVAKHGRGNISKGHDRLDRLVHETRKKTIRQMRKLPGPKK